MRNPAVWVMIEPREVRSMVDQVFDIVWYLPRENRWRDLNLLAYRDTGKLTVSENSLQFNGSKETVVINNIQRVTIGKQGRDFINNWVRIEYGDTSDPSVAFFADGSMLGWGGIFGGTKRILEAVIQRIQNGGSFPKRSVHR